MISFFEACLFATLTVGLTYLQIAYSPWSYGKPWRPSDKDEVNLSTANEKYIPWMTSLMNSLSKTVWDNEEKAELLMKRQDKLQSTGNCDECGILQSRLDHWLEDLKQVGIEISPFILKHKPIFGDMAHIRSQRVAGNVYFDDSAMSKFMLGGDSIGGAFLVAGLLTINAFVSGSFFSIFF